MDTSSQQDQLNTSQASLFIILLTFFIIITSNAEFSVERSQEVMKSVNKTFAASGKSRIGTLGIKMEDDGFSNLRTDFLRDMLEVSAPLTEVTANRRVSIYGENRMGIKLMPGILFASEKSAELRDNANVDLKNLAARIRYWRDRADIKIHFVIAGNNIDEKLARKRVMAISDAMALSTDYFTPGINISEQKSGEIIFSIEKLAAPDGSKNHI